MAVNRHITGGSAHQGGNFTAGKITDDNLLFPCSADHDRDWPPYKVFFSGWQPIIR